VKNYRKVLEESDVSEKFRKVLEESNVCGKCISDVKALELFVG
jgi:hypothetical protein